MNRPRPPRPLRDNTATVTASVIQRMLDSDDASPLELYNFRDIRHLADYSLDLGE